MRARWTTVLSLGGVLFAGTAAALVNTQVLRSSGDNGGLGNEISVAVSPAGTSTSAAGDGKVSAATLVPVSVAPVAPVASQATYQIGEAGAVTLDTAGDMLAVVAAVPSPGWSVVQVEQVDAFNVEVQLRSGDTVVEFRANLLFGVVSTSVESKNEGSGGDDGAPVTVATSARPVTTSATTNATPPAPTPPAGTTATVVPTATTDHDSDDSHDDHDDHGSSNTSGGGGDDDHDDD